MDFTPILFWLMTLKTNPSSIQELLILANKIILE